MLLAGAIVMEVGGTLCLRASDGFRKRLWIAPIALAYIVSFSLLALTLRAGMPVGIAYGIWAGSGVALTAIAAYILFREPLTWLMGVGILTIVSGILLIEFGN